MQKITQAITNDVRLITVEHISTDSSASLQSILRPLAAGRSKTSAQLS